MITETWKRHLAKTISWRTVGFLSLSLLCFVTTGSALLAGSIAGLDLVVKSILYFLHESVWSKVNFGKTLASRKGCVVWFTGLSGAGKTTLADALAKKLEGQLLPVKRLDGDVARKTFSSNLGFTLEDRAENCRRAAHIASYLKQQHIVLASFISPTPEMRNYIKEVCGSDVILVYVKCSIEECERRDPKGMYAILESGKFKGVPFTGKHPAAEYFEPSQSEADLVIDTESKHLDHCVERLYLLLRAEGHV